MRSLLRQRTTRAKKTGDIKTFKSLGKQNFQNEAYRNSLFPGEEGAATLKALIDGIQGVSKTKVDSKVGNERWALIYNAIYSNFNAKIIQTLKEDFSRYSATKTSENKGSGEVAAAADAAAADDAGDGEGSDVDADE